MAWFRVRRGVVRVPAERHSRFTLLTWHFFRRFLDNDLISPNGDAHVGLSQTIAAIVTPGLLATAMVSFRYGFMWRASWNRILEMSVPDGLLFVSLSMILLGLAATVCWDAFYLDARDRNILAVLPVPERLLSAAKLGALCLFLAAFVLAANLVPALLIPGLMLVPLKGGGTLALAAPMMLAHAASTFLAGAWCMLAVVAVRGLIALLLPARLFQRVSPFVQGVLVLALLGWAIALSPFLDSAQGIVVRGGPARDLSPPIWFLGLYQWIIGNPWPEYEPLAHTALAATGITVAIVLLVFFAPRQRRGEHVMAAPAAGTFKGAVATLRTLAARLAVAHPRGRASFTFTLTTMGRSTKHRIYLAAAFGAGLAWAVTGLILEFARDGRAALGTGTPSLSALQVQAVLVLFLVVAVRFGVLVPAALPANWLFRITERRPLGVYFTGARRAALAVGLLPVAALAPLSALAWGWQAAAYHLLVGALYAAFIVELLFNGLARFPCAAAYVSGQLKLKSRGVYYFFAVTVLTGLPSLVESLAFRGQAGPLTLPLWLVALATALAYLRRQKERALPGLIFDDPNDEDYQTLRLNE